MCELAAFNASHDMLMPLLNKSTLIVSIETVVALKYNPSNQFSVTKECAAESAHKGND